tara:strand:- start:342 stop:1034 length:693 start_codon:yes stop_codon:yes gene_type:complete
MLQYIGKKYKYFFFGFLFILLSTVNNTQLLNIFSFNSKVKTIEVLGLDNDLNENIRNKMEFLTDDNIFNINENKIISSLNDYPFIDKYKVSKIYPSKLIIYLTKTDYLAKIMVSNIKYIVGSNGRLIDNKFVKDEIELPNIFGNYSEKSFLNLIKKINYTKFNYKQIKNLYFFPSERWDIELKNNLVIKLPKNNLESSLKKINKLIKDKKFRNIKIVDLRIPGQIIILNE